MKELKQGGYWELWNVSYPLILVNASHSIMQFTDRKFLSMKSTVDVAAALPGGILCFTLFSFFLVTTTFTSAIVAQFHGKGDKAACARVPWAGFVFALFAGLLSSYALLPLGGWLIGAGGHSPELMERELAYFEALMPGAGFACAGAAFCSFFSGQGKTLVVAAIQFIGCGLNVLLAYLMIFGCSFCPALGIVGAGVSTTLASACSALLAFLAFVLVDQRYYPTRKWAAMRVADLKRMLAFGAPCGVEVLCGVGAFTFIVFLIGKLGDVSMTATTICLSINMLSFLPLLGMSEATSVVVGKYVGMGRRDIGEAVGYRAWKMASLYMLLAGAVFVLFPNELFGFFSPKSVDGIDFAAVMSYARPLLLCVAFYNFFDASFNIYMGAVRGAGDTAFPMWVTILSSWLVMVPGVMLLIDHFHCSVIGVWVFISAYILMVGAIMYFRFRSGAWKKFDMTAEPAAEGKSR